MPGEPGTRNWPGGGGGDLGFIPAPRPRGFGRVRGALAPTLVGQRREEEGGGGVRGGGVRGGEGGGGRGGVGTAGERQGGARGGTLPPQITRMLREKRNRKTVSLNFEKFIELPEVNNVHGWMKEEGLLNQDNQQYPGRQVDWLERNVFAKKCFVHMKEEEGAEWMQQQFGGEGREWEDPETGEVMMITARWEGGPTWRQLVIKGINPNTPVEVVEEVFRKYGEIKQFQYEDIEGFRWNQATLLVKTRNEAEIPVYIFPGHHRVT